MKNGSLETKTEKKKPFLSALEGKTGNSPPFWLMRQAGRYLPEYRAVREKAGGFLDLVFDPEKSVEVTLQPLRRYRMDAAILFSDILVVPGLLGQDIGFAAGEGPVLDPVRTEKDIENLSFDENYIAPVYKTVSGIRAALVREGFHDTALIGFAGSPWTICAYMVEGGGSRDFLHARTMAFNDPVLFAKLIGIVTEATVMYLRGQIEAGAEAVQLFDSWAGLLDEEQYARWVIEPTRAITQVLNRDYPNIPVIGFPRGSGVLYERYARETGVTAIGLDQHVPLSSAKKLQEILPIQGNLDPVRLLAGGDAMDSAVNAIMESLAAGPFIFNLGHGVIKETPPEHVERLAGLVRNFRS